MVPSGLSKAERATEVGAHQPPSLGHIPVGPAPQTNTLN